MTSWLNLRPGMFPLGGLARLLAGEIDRLQAWLDGFEATTSGRARRARLGDSGQYVIVERMPLPDGYRPDEIDLLLIVDNFPSLPPFGLYVLNRGTEGVVSQLRSRYNVFPNRAFHEAHSIPGYSWICYHYADNRWAYNGNAPDRGDNLSKFLSSFYAEAEQ